MKRLVIFMLLCVLFALNVVGCVPRGNGDLEIEPVTDIVQPLLTLTATSDASQAVEASGVAGTATPTIGPPSKLSGLIIVGGQEAFAIDPGCVLTNDCMDRAVPLMQAFDNSPLVDLPRLAPTGDRLAFLYGVNPRQSGMDIYTSDLDGKNIVRLTYEGEKENLTWSPDGERIAFTTRIDGAISYLSVIDANDGTLLARFDEIDYYELLAWSPDGKRIAFLNSPVNINDLYVVDIESGEHILLASQVVIETPSWSPDGKNIAVSIERDANIDIYSITADGSGEQRLTADPDRDDSPAWSPND